MTGMIKKVVLGAVAAVVAAGAIDIGGAEAKGRGGFGGGSGGFHRGGGFGHKFGGGHNFNGHRNFHVVKFNHFGYGYGGYDCSLAKFKFLKVCRGY